MIDDIRKAWPTMFMFHTRSPTKRTSIQQNKIINKYYVWVKEVESKG